MRVFFHKSLFSLLPCWPTVINCSVQARLTGLQAISRLDTKNFLIWVQWELELRSRHQSHLILPTSILCQIHCGMEKWVCFILEIFRGCVWKPYNSSPAVQWDADFSFILPLYAISSLYQIPCGMARNGLVVLVVVIRLIVAGSNFSNS